MNSEFGIEPFNKIGVLKNSENAICKIYGIAQNATYLTKVRPHTNFTFPGKNFSHFDAFKRDIFSRIIDLQYVFLLYFVIIIYTKNFLLSIVF